MSFEKEQYITAGVSPARKIITVSIPYADYRIDVTVSSEEGTRILHDEDVRIMHKEPGKTYYIDVTSTFITKFSEYKRIKPTSSNLLVLAGLLYNHVNAQ